MEKLRATMVSVRRVLVAVSLRVPDREKTDYGWLVHRRASNAETSRKVHVTLYSIHYRISLGVVWIRDGKSRVLLADGSKPEKPTNDDENI